MQKWQILEVNANLRFWKWAYNKDGWMEDIDDHILFLLSTMQYENISPENEEED